ncbi:methylosome subunit pICln [Athalia rosae]|uniref:methylosome subunit pICln n=1 Tax=Athalia rosae TaxID=37344 RepID=UPI0006257D5F|nr:methylosome subunit pICln [Athalia rosae]
MVVLSNFLPPREGIRHEEPETTLYVNEREIGKGTIYVTESQLSWVNGATGQGFSLQYPHISLHAVSRDQQVHPRQCLYIMVDTKLDFPDIPEMLPVGPRSGGDQDEDEDEDDSEPEMTEMRFAPENVNSLDAMFQAMSQCQALHPDPQDSFLDAEEDIFEDAEEDDFEYYQVAAGDGPYILASEQVQSQNGGGPDEAMDVEAGQFEDAEEDP